MSDHAAASWGLWPILFTIGDLVVPAYPVFVGLAVLVAMVGYWWESRTQQLPGEHAVLLLVAALVGGTLGAKLPVWITHRDLVTAHMHDPAMWLSGRTIVGGLIGGTLTVILTRRRLGITTPMGNLFAPSLALAFAIGRLGCLCQGCCYGVATTLPWAINLGDGVLRHPTQIYEAVFAVALFGTLLILKRRITRPGQLFALLMIGYFSFRFFVEFLRFEPRPYAGFTAAQLVSLCIVGYYGYRQLKTRAQSQNEAAS